MGSTKQPVSGCLWTGRE